MKTLKYYVKDVLVNMAIEGKLDGDMNCLDIDMVFDTAYKKQVENLLMYKYGIGINDCTNEEEIKQEFEDGTKAEDFVDWIGEKHQLIPIDK